MFVHPGHSGVGSPWRRPFLSGPLPTYISYPNWHEWAERALIQKKSSALRKLGEAGVIGTDRILGLREAFRLQFLFAGQGIQQYPYHLTKQLTTKRYKC